MSYQEAEFFVTIGADCHKPRGFSLLRTLGSRAVCSIANGCIPVNSRGGNTHQCKSGNSPKDDYESARNVTGKRLGKC
jgi:hypothetical protein